ncbi:MAG: aromatic ring-hydroxylating dioxygenase subunit alpha [Hyphomicrobiaceae bacterium]
MMVETLPARWYVDPAILQRERTAIFARNWTLFGPEHEVMEPGSWRSQRLNGWSIVVARDTSGTLHAFHNVCRHRGAELVEGDGRGQCRLLVCPYHAWSYDLDGRLVRVPNFGEEADFDASKHGLFPVRVDTWAGLVFVCLDAEAPGLMEWLGPIPELCKPYPVASSMEYHSSFAVEGACNWKAYCDNTVEGYHLPTVHKRLTAAVDRDNTSIKSYEGGRLVVFDVTYQATGTDLRGSKGIWFYRFPGFQGVAGARTFKADRIEPLAVDRMRYTDWSWFVELSAAERQDSMDWSREIAAEDIGVCETVQRNLAAGIYDTGLLSPVQEGHIARLQQLVRELVGEIDG